MMGADKIKIVNAYKGGKNEEFITQINPASIKIGKKIAYEKIQAMGREEYLSRYKNHEPATMSFEIYMDNTGVIPTGGKTIPERIEQMEQAIYKKKQDIQEPGYAILVWGDIIFHGRAESIDYDYTMFASDGSPLRVKISLSFVGYFRESAPKINKSSQASSVITFESGDTLASYCKEIYDDESFCLEVASKNGLGSIRNVAPGTKLYFPPLT